MSEWSIDYDDEASDVFTPWEVWSGGTVFRTDDEADAKWLLETLNKSEAKEALARFGAQVFDNHGNEFGLSVGQIAVICGIKDQHDGSALPGIKEAVEELINAN